MNCYAYGEGCDSTIVDAPTWYDCYWYNDCGDEGTSGADAPAGTSDDASWADFDKTDISTDQLNFYAWLACQDTLGLLSTDPQAECDHLDTPEDLYWNCYFTNTNCEAATGDADWYTCHWLPENCGKPDEPFWDVTTFEGYV